MAQRCEGSRGVWWICFWHRAKRRRRGGNWKKEQGKEGWRREREREREREGGGEETRDSRKERDVPNDFRNWQKNSNPITAAGLSFVSLSPCISLFSLPELVMTDHLGQSKVKLKKLCLYIKNTAAAGESVQHTGDQSHVYTLPHSRRDAEISRQVLWGVSIQVMYLYCFMTLNLRTCQSLRTVWAV